MITPNRVLLKIIVILCGFHPICAQRKGNAQQKSHLQSTPKTESLWQQ